MNKQREIAKIEMEITSAIEAAVPLLNAASRAAHKLKDVEAEEDPEQVTFDRLVDLGMITDCAARMCGPNLNILARVVLALLNDEHDEHDTDEVEHQHP